MILEDVLQGFGGVVEREADVLGLPLCLQALHEVPGAQLVGFLFPLCAHGVEQVKVVVLQAGTVQALLEDGFQLFNALLVPQGQLGGALEAVTGIAVHHSLFQSHFRLAADVHVSGVKIGKTLGHEGVHHPLYLLNVDLFAQHGQAHQAKAQILDAFTQILVGHFTFLP